MTEASLGDGIFPGGALCERARAHRHRQRFEHPAGCGRGAAPARVRAAPRAPCAQRARRQRRHLHRAAACSMRRWQAACQALLAGPGRPGGGRLARSGHAARARPGARWNTAATSCSTAGSFPAGRSAIDCVWRAGVKLVSDGGHHERDAIRGTLRRRRCGGCAVKRIARGTSNAEEASGAHAGADRRRFAVAGIALHRHEPINALWIVTAAVCVYLLGLSRSTPPGSRPACSGSIPTRATPAERLNNGRDFVPTHRAIVFGHHFAAIAGPGPLVGTDARRPVRLPARDAVDPGGRGVRRLRAGHDHPAAVHPPRRPQPRADGAR